MTKLSKVLRVLFAIVFWSWNALFVLVLAMGFIPFVFVELVGDAWDGLARWSTVGWAAMLFFFPIVVVVIAFKHLRKEPLALFVAFFGVEVPAFALSCVRLFGLSDLHGAAGLTLAGVVVGGLALVLHLAGARMRLLPP